MGSRRKRNDTFSASQLRELAERQGFDRIAAREGVQPRTVARWARQGVPKGRQRTLAASWRRSEGARRAALHRSAQTLRRAVSEARQDSQLAKRLHAKGIAISDRELTRLERRFELLARKLETHPVAQGDMLRDIARLSQADLASRASAIADAYGLSSTKEVYSLYYSPPGGGKSVSVAG